MFGARVAFFLGFLSVTKETKLSVSKVDSRKQVSFHQISLGSTQEWHTFSSRHTQGSSILHTLISAELNLCCNIHSVQLSRGEGLHSAPLSISNFPLELLLIHITRLIFSARSLTTSLLYMRF